MKNFVLNLDLGYLDQRSWQTLVSQSAKTFAGKNNSVIADFKRALAAESDYRRRGLAEHAKIEINLEGVSQAEFNDAIVAFGVMGMQFAQTLQFRAAAVVVELLHGIARQRLVGDLGDMVPTQKERRNLN